MRTHKKVSLYTALLGAGALGAAGAAQAVYLSPDGRGDVLIYPYYTTRADSLGNAYTTLLSVVNPTQLAKAVKVRFLEGKHGRSVEDFNLFLAPFDVWTAAILPDLTGGGARIGTLDASCTLPPFSASATAPFVSFSNAAYSGTSDDGAGATLDRTNEGYFEIIETATYDSLSATGKAIFHVNGAAPCGTNLTDTQAAADAQPVKGGLFGSATLINVSAGTDYTYDPVALANFYQVGSNYSPAGERLPTLESAAPPSSIVNGPGGIRYESLWSGGGSDAVSAVLMHDSILNEFTLDTATKSGTDWVVTMPTKQLYFDSITGDASQLFQRNFNGSAGSCDDVVLNIWDREARTQTGPLNFTPAPPTPSSSICWDANVITFNNTSVFGSKNVANLQTSGFQNGWLTLGFPTGIAGATATVHQLINRGSTSITIPGGMTTLGNSATYVGLPVVGFAVSSFTNGTLQVGTPPTTVLSNYGGNFVHKTNTTIQ
jgi:hypothetical protein